jgi:hypothetical protein
MSEGVIEVHGEKESTQVCTQTPTEFHPELGGGEDSESSSIVQTSAATSLYTETCVEQFVTVYPANRNADNASVGTQNVKVGKILVIISPSSTNLTAAGGNAHELIETEIIHSSSGDTKKLKLLGDINMSGHGIDNIAFLNGMGGKWSIDSTGLLVVEGIKTQNLEVGNSSNVSGITLYDEVTGSPYCLRVSNAAVVSLSGACTDIGSTSTSTGTTTEEIDDTEVIDDDLDLGTGSSSSTSTSENLIDNSQNVVATSTSSSTDDTIDTTDDQTATSTSNTASTAGSTSSSTGPTSASGADTTAADTSAVVDTSSQSSTDTTASGGVSQSIAAEADTSATSLNTGP